MASKHFTLRLPESLWERVELRASIQSRKPSELVLEAIERGWDAPQQNFYVDDYSLAQPSVLKYVPSTTSPNAEPRPNPLDIPGVFLGSQLGNRPAIEDDEPEPAR